MPYDPHFTGQHVPLPQLNAAQKKDLVKRSLGAGSDHDHLLSQPNFTIALSASRKLAYFSASNIDMGQKQNIRRADLTGHWRVEQGIAKHQIVGDPWYKVSNKGFQRGHLTPADAMEWGATEEEAIANANSTFFFSNAAPQIPRLNGEVWRQLEMFVSKEGAKAGNARLNVCTGPILHSNDPVYVHRIDGQALQIPRTYWKIIWYIGPQQQLSRIGFIMSQETLLKKSGLIEEDLLEAVSPFESLGAFKTYQVNISLIESLSGLKFAPALNPFKDERPRALALQKSDLLESFSGGGEKIIEGLVW